MITAPVRWVRGATAPSAVGIASRGAKVTVSSNWAGASKVSASSRACRRTLVHCKIKLRPARRLVRDALVGCHYLGRVGDMFDNEQKNQLQPHEQHAECDLGDRYVEQNTHDRGPPRWPSTDREIYARIHLYGTRFPRTSDNISRARELVGISITQCRQRVELSGKIGFVPQPSHFVCDEAPALSSSTFRPDAAVAPLGSLVRKFCR